MAQPPSACDFNWQAPAFSLLATDGKSYALRDIAGQNGTLVMFICNHCPYVLSALARIKRDAVALMDLGIGVAAICSNDALSHPGDSFENMAILAREQALPFVYLHDADQSVARQWQASCTPDFFGFNADMGLQYRGRLDAAGRAPVAGARRDLFEAMKLIAQTGQGPAEQTPSMGCSIKWKS